MDNENCPGINKHCKIYGCVGRSDCRRELPRILILGHGRHGKDTVGELLEAYGFVTGSSSFFMAGYVRDYLESHGIVYYPDEYKAWENRHKYRKSWYDAIQEYNKDDRARMCRDILAAHDVYTGMRAVNEYEASVGLFDLVIWVDASERHELEPKSSMELEYDPSTMYYIDNNGTLDELAQHVDYLIQDYWPHLCK
ncbi:MAG: hypothetical protein HRU32_15470 [Rhodobacteraceae bacterium]|nr:hypothetical protein [Paracoccaceae bacterium]